MVENSAIEWTHHTFNPWIGCTKISPACDNCYAESFVRNRMGKPELWQGERHRTKTWRDPIRWNKRAAEHGVRERVFCASLADVFDNQVPDEWRADLWLLISATLNLDWLLLTKRPQNISKMLPRMASKPGMMWPWPNVWLGTTVENQAEADRRIPHLLAAPARVHFLSCEPLLGPVDIRAYMPNDLWNDLPSWKQTELSWVIAGGESGPGARPSHPDWFRSLRDQCQAARVPFLFKQWGDWLPDHQSYDATPYAQASVGSRFDDGSFTSRVGKKAAGRLLDGVLHDEYPEVRSA